jgi:hypothetical protein
MDSSIAVPFPVVLVFSLFFARPRLFARQNATVVAVLFVYVLSVAGAISPTLELDQSFEGLFQVPGAALVQLGR